MPLDTAIGPIVRIISNDSFQMHVTHVGTHNAYRYGNYEIIHIAPASSSHPIPLTTALVGRRVKCQVRYRDNYNRLYGEVFFE
jgi:hypothetical protein